MEDIDRSLSIKLYDVMDQVGVSERIRKLYQDIAIRTEIMYTIENQIKDVPVTMYTFGSDSEGTTLADLNSDVDHVYCHAQWLVIDDIHTAPPDLSWLMVRDNHTYPGYVKLQRVNNGTPSTIFNTTITNPEIANKYDTDTEGRICRKHVILCENVHDHERHGPADSAPGHSGIQDRDHVFALRCRTIPKYAQTWLHRRRQYNWPSRDNLKKMSDLDCFVVGVGHSSSREHQIEWRLSFSLQERLLMFSLNSTQHKCYVLLKIIKNDIIKAEIGESISSYHCKTCIFYALEATQAAIWRPENLICCVRLCLMILLKWVEKECCPNYFIPSENMFDKPQFRDKRYRLLQSLKAIIADERPILLHLRCGDISKRILQPGIVHNNMTDKIVYGHYINMFDKPKFRANRYRLLELLKAIIAEEMSILLRMRCGHIRCRMLQRKIVQNNMTDIIVFNGYMNFCLQIDRFSKAIYTLCNNRSANSQNVIMVLAQYVERFKNMRVIDEHSEQQTSDAISFVIPVLHLHIAQRLASFVCNGQDHEYARQLLYLSICHFQLGNHADLMTSRLLIVSFLLRLEKYDLCINILEEIEHDLKRYVVTQCSCYLRRSLRNADLRQHLSTNNVSCKTAIRTVFVGCVRFARCDTEITPLPLQYEMYRSIGTPPGSRNESEEEVFDLSAIDGKVYLYFLQYLVYSRLNRPSNKQVAIDNLVWVLGDDLNLFHKETAYNLLGWIYVQERRIPDALRCFMTSWRIRPDHNAAKFHVLQLAQDIMRH